MVAISTDPSISEFYYERAFGYFVDDDPRILSLPPLEHAKLYRSNWIQEYTMLLRDHQVLSVFSNLVLPNFAKGKVIRVASVGCSTGQEPYSLLLSNWENKDRLKIDGFDSNTSSLEKAIKGEYQIDLAGITGEYQDVENLGLANPKEAYVITEKVIAGRKAHFFNFTDTLKRRVFFQNHDIFESPLPEKYDVILLLNVLMHYKPKGRERILHNIHESMEDGGWLLCERTPNISEKDEERIRYRQWMRDIMHLGFEKQNVILQEFFFKDQTLFSQIYRKNSRLRITGGKSK
jgi:chemotaxis methyl-accepting protein methylase